MQGLGQLASANDPCAPFFGGHEVLSRACYAKIWTTHCATKFWKENWRSHKGALRTKKYDEIVDDILLQRPYHCWSHESSQDTCSKLGVYLQWATTLLQTGYIPDNKATGFVGPELILDLADASLRPCILFHFALRVLLQMTPEVFTNRTRVLAARRGLHRGVPFHLFEGAFRNFDHEVLIEHRGIFGVIRAWSEAHLSQNLRLRGIVGVDTCVQVGFHRRACSIHRGAAGAANTSLLVPFYRHRDPGLPQALVARLKGEQDSLLRASGFLAAADRLRNTGADYGEELGAAISILQGPLASGARVEYMLPAAGRPQHLVWHFLDRLALELTVPVKIERPYPDSPDPVYAEIEMSLLPDRDLVSDYVRRTGTFHCPGGFQRLAARLTSMYAVNNSRPLRAVEVGGFLGDCLLWAGGWLGPTQLRGLEIEPVAAATKRFAQSLARANLSGAVGVVTEALGDGALHEYSMVGRGGVSANPNFHLHHGQAASAGPGSTSFRPRTLDQVLEGWSGLPPGASVDLLRVKAAGSEPPIIVGLRRHLAAARVRWLMIQTAPAGAATIQQFLSQWPHYELDTRHTQPAKSTFVYRLVEAELQVD